MTSTSGGSSFDTGIAPWLSVADAVGAAAFSRAAFGAIETYRFRSTGVGP